MGHEQSKLRKSSSKLQQTSFVDPNNLPLVIREIYYTAQLKRGHRKASQNLKEKDLKAFMEQSSADIIEKFEKAGTIVNLSKEMHALDLVMQYCDILTDNISTFNHPAAPGNADRIKEMMPYIGSLLFACHKLNIEAGITLAQMLNEKLSINTFTEKTPEILACLGSTLPSEQEISDYLSQFSQKSSPKSQPKPEPSSQGQGNNNDLQSQPQPQLQLRSSSNPLPTPRENRFSHSQTPRHDGDRQYDYELEDSEYGKFSQMTASFPHQSESDRILAESKFSRQNQRSRTMEPDVAMSFGGPKIPMQFNNNNHMESDKHEETMDTEEKSPSKDQTSPIMGSPMAVSQSIKMSKYPDLGHFSVRSLDMGHDSQVMSKQLMDRLNSVRQNL